MNWLAETLLRQHWKHWGPILQVMAHDAYGAPGEKKPKSLWSYLDLTSNTAKELQYQVRLGTRQHQEIGMNWADTIMIEIVCMSLGVQPRTYNEAWDSTLLDWVIVPAPTNVYYAFLRTPGSIKERALLLFTGESDEGHYEPLFACESHNDSLPSPTPLSNVANIFSQPQVSLESLTGELWGVKENYDGVLRKIDMYIKYIDSATIQVLPQSIELMSRMSDEDLDMHANEGDLPTPNTYNHSSLERMKRFFGKFNDHIN
jgi:uncharacterized protein YlzI (FlbEa/FlbD family)